MEPSHPRTRDPARAPHGTRTRPGVLFPIFQQQRGPGPRLPLPPSPSSSHQDAMLAGLGTWGLQRPGHACSLGPHLPGLLQERTPGSSREPWGGEEQCPSQSSCCHRSLTVERVSQAQLQGATIAAATGPRASAVCVCEHADMEGAHVPGDTCVCKHAYMNGNTCACEVTATLLSSRPTLACTCCLPLPHIGVSLLAPGP